MLNTTMGPFGFSMILPYIAISLLLNVVFSAEIDSFTTRKEQMKPSYPSSNEDLDIIARGLIDDALVTVNHKGKTCSLLNLDEKLNAYLGDIHIAGQSVLFSRIENDIMTRKSKYLPGKTLHAESPKGPNVYSDFSDIEERGFVSKSNSPKAVKYDYKIKGEKHPILVGGDKFAHFFAQGHYAFKKLIEGLKSLGAGHDEINPKALKPALQYALKWNYKTENGSLGLGIDEDFLIFPSYRIGSGVFSYGDLASNFGGIRFYLSLADNNLYRSFKKHMPFMVIDKPLFKCDNGKWLVKEPFTFEKFVTPAWDEAINPSRFLTPEMQTKFDNKLKAYFARDLLPTYQLPLEPKLCQAAGKEYVEKYVQEKILHPKCLELLK
jgi:hypothetical protein